MKRVLVIGGAGFIGSHLLKQLAASDENLELTCLDIAEPRFRVARVNYINFDITKPIPDELFSVPDTIYNFAAVHTTPGHPDWEYYWTNVLGAVHACDYASRNNVNEIVFTSSIAAYGPSEEPLEEDSELRPESAYGRSKLAAEKIHRFWLHEKSERKLVVVRPAVIYGLAEKGNFTRLAGLLKKGQFVYPGRKDTIKSCGYVEDLVSSFAFALSKPEKEITYNYAHPERYTSEDICAAFAEVAGYKKATRVIPMWFMLTAAFPFEILHSLGLKNSINRARMWKLNRSTNVIPKWLVDNKFPYRFSLVSSLENWKSMSPSSHFD